LCYSATATHDQTAASEKADGSQNIENAPEMKTEELTPKEKELLLQNEKLQETIKNVDVSNF